MAIPLPSRRVVGSIATSCLILIARQGLAQAQEPPAGAPYSPYPASVLVTKVKHFDNMCWKIAAAGGTFYFETGETGGKSGFSSAFDPVGNDWIGNDADKGYNKSPANGGKHEYRGWPNFGVGDFDHPQRASGTSTRWVDEAGKDVAFADKLEGDHLRMRSSNATYEIEYHFFRTHAAIKVIKAGDKYAFLYEGPIGGEQEAPVEKDYYVLSDGKPRACKEGGLGYLEPEFGNKFPSPFFYMVDSDPKDTHVWYVGVKGGAPDTAGDEGWRQGTNMVIFSYGRDQDKRAYTGTAAVSVFGFLPKADGHAAISSFINARLEAPFTSAGGVGSGGTGGAGMGGAAGAGMGGAAGAGMGGAAGAGTAGAGTAGAGTAGAGTAGAGTAGAGTAGAGTAGAGTAGAGTPAGGAPGGVGGASAGGAPGAAGSSGVVAPPSEDSGCSVTRSSRNSEGLWSVLALFPLAAALRGARRRRRAAIGLRKSDR